MAKQKTACLPKENIENALQALKDAGLKITPTRKHVLRFLTHAHGPFSIEEIQNGILPESCNLTTLYRMIAQFEEIKLVRRSELGDGIARYEYHCAQHPHHHLICRDCKKIEVFDQDLIPQIKKIAQNKGFTEISPYLEIFGLCKKCHSLKT